MPATPNETTPRQFRLTEETLSLLDKISGHYGVKSRADAIRIAARLTADQITPAVAPKKIRNKSERTT